MLAALAPLLSSTQPHGVDRTMQQSQLQTQQEQLTFIGCIQQAVFYMDVNFHNSFKDDYSHFTEGKAEK